MQTETIVRCITSVEEFVPHLDLVLGFDLIFLTCKTMTVPPLEHTVFDFCSSGLLQVSTVRKGEKCSGP